MMFIVKSTDYARTEWFLRGKNWVNSAIAADRFTSEKEAQWALDAVRPLTVSGVFKNAAVIADPEGGTP